MSGVDLKTEQKKSGRDNERKRRKRVKRNIIVRKTNGISETESELSALT